MNYSKLNSHLNVVLINISLLYTGEQIRKRVFLFIDIWLNKAKWNLLTLSMERSERKAVLYNSLLHVFLQLFHSGLLQNNTVCASYFLLKEKKKAVVTMCMSYFPLFLEQSIICLPVFTWFLKPLWTKLILPHWTVSLPTE